MVCLRKTLCAFACLLAVGLPVSAAGSAPSSIPVRAPGVSISAHEFVASSVLADTWTWREFWKFWKRQLDKTAGVVGMVLLVGLGAMVLIISKTRR